MLLAALQDVLVSPTQCVLKLKSVVLLTEVWTLILMSLDFSLLTWNYFIYLPKCEDLK